MVFTPAYSRINLLIVTYSKNEIIANSALPNYRMATKDKLYEAFGELLYSVAIADGSVQHEEKKALQEILKMHPWAQDILWSFNYEENRTHQVKDTYLKAIDTFKEHGPFEEYEKFIEVLEIVAAAFGGITEEERNLIGNFRNDLLTTFRNNPDIY